MYTPRNFTFQSFNNKKFKIKQVLKYNTMLTTRRFTFQSLRDNKSQRFNKQ